MTVFAVFREGVHRHECGGIFTTPAAATAVADGLALNDGDDWHAYHVVPFELDVPTTGLVGSGGWHVSPTLEEAEPVYRTSKSKQP